MKKLICTLALGAGLLLGLSGCDLYQPDVDSLLTPPVLSELQTEVDEALRDVVGQELRLCYPAGGSYRSPYIFTDLDGDEELIVSRDEPVLELDDLLYQLAVLSIPMKRVHADGECNADSMRYYARQEEEERKQRGTLLTDTPPEEE